MSYYTPKELETMSFKWLGKKVNISDKASIYDYEKIENEFRSNALIKKHFIVWAGSIVMHAVTLAAGTARSFHYILSALSVFISARHSMQARSGHFTFSARPPLQRVKMRTDKLTHADEFFI